MAIADIKTSSYAGNDSSFVIRTIDSVREHFLSSDSERAELRELVRSVVRQAQKGRRTREDLLAGKVISVGRQWIISLVPIRKALNSEWSEKEIGFALRELGFRKIRVTIRNNSYRVWVVPEKFVVNACLKKGKSLIGYLRRLWREGIL